MTPPVPMSIPFYSCKRRCLHSAIDSDSTPALKQTKSDSGRLRKNGLSHKPFDIDISPFGSQPCIFILQQLDNAEERGISEKDFPCSRKSGAVGIL